MPKSLQWVLFQSRQLCKDYPMTEISSSTTAREALATYYKTHYFGDRALTDSWVSVRLGPVSVPFPNPKHRREAIPLHDLHHMLTGYDTTWTGEGEVAAWELGSGFPCRHWVGYFYAPITFTIGFFVSPKRVIKAFRRGRGNQNLCHLDLRIPRDQLFQMSLSELKEELRLGTVMKATETYQVCYPNPLILKAGDKIQLFEKESPEKWRDWKWCKDLTGNEGWISETYFKRLTPNEATLIKDYTAQELAVASGDEIELIFTDCGWSWCRKTSGDEGWLPTEILK